MDIEKYKVGELAQMVGVNIQTVRYYERINLLPEVDRSMNGYRVYTDLHIKFLEHIIFAKELGFSLNEIKEYIQDARKNDFNEVYILNVLNSKKKCIDDEIKILKQKSSLLEKKINMVNRDIDLTGECEVKKIIKSLT